MICGAVINYISNIILRIGLLPVINIKPKMKTPIVDDILNLIHGKHK